MDKIIITNNNLVQQEYYEKFEKLFLDGFTYLQVLEYVRDKIHQGHKLLTHPLSGSVKPNETPFKSIIISKKQIVMCFTDLSIIEESIASTKRFMNNQVTPLWSEKILDDFRIIDLSLIENAMSNMHF